MPAGTQQHGTDTTYSAFNSPSLNNSPSTLPSGYAGTYGAANLKTWPSGGILTTGTLEDLRKGTNQLAKDFNTAIVSHQSQITTNDGHLDKINVNLNELKTDSIEIANDLSNKAWDTITIVAGTGLVDTHGTDDTADDISGNPSGKNLKSDIQIDLVKATSTEIGGVLSSDTAITDSAVESSVAGHITVNSSTGAMKLLNNAVQLGTHTRGSYVKLIGGAGTTGKGGALENILITGQGNTSSGGSGFQSASVTLDISDTGVGSSFAGSFLGSTSSTGGITTVTVPSFKVDKKGRITEANSSITGDFATNQNIVISAGTNLSGGGTVTSNAGTSQTLTINHEASTLSAGTQSVGTTITHDTSGIAQNGDGKFGAFHRQVNIVDSITTDAQGHITGIATRPITYGLDSPAGNTTLGSKYSENLSFDLHVPTEKDFQALQQQVTTLEGDVIRIPSTGPVTINRNISANNDLLVADNLTVDVDTLLVEKNSSGAAGDGQVGIGISPARKLDVSGTGRFSGALEVGGGLYVNDQILHTGDSGSDTSIRFPADDTFTITTAGTERFRVDSSGNVGIGDTSPGVPLDIADDSNVQLRLRSTTSSNNTRITFGPNSTDAWNIGVNAVGGDFSFYDIVNNLTRLAIDTDGDVGIGTQSPTGKLHVSNVGESRIDIEDTDGTGSQKFRIFVRNSDDTFAIYDGTNTRTWFRYIANSTVANQKLTLLEGNGNVGIRTTNPSYALDVNGTIRSQSTLRAATNLIVGTTIQAASGNFDVDSSGNISDVNNIVSGGDISATGTISADTFLGIGTNTPDSNDSIDGRTYGPYKFQVENGDSKFAGNVNVTGNLNVTGISSTGSTADVDFNSVDLADVGAISMSGALSSTNTTQSTNVNSGSLILDGGAGIAKNVFVGGTLNVTGATTLGTLSAGGGGFDIDSSGNITDVGSIAAGGRITINGTSLGTIAQTTATNGHLQLVHGSDILAFDPNEIFATNSLQIGVADGKDISFFEGGDAHLTIENGGNVGIGTTSPSSALHIIKDGTGVDLLTLGGNLGSTAGNRDMHIVSPATDNANTPYKFVTGNAFTFRVDTEDVLNIDSDRKVGIGTTSPDDKLHVVGDIRATGGDILSTHTGSNAILNTHTTGGTVTLRHGVTYGLVGTTSNTKFTIRTNDTDRIAVLANGNVGIGTSDPDEKLEVSGKVKISNTSTIFNTGPANAPLRVGSDTGFIGIDSNEIETLGSDLTLRVPHNKLFQVQSRIDTDTSGTYANTLMQVLANGNVGIGTTSPTSKLHVAGTSAFDSHLHVGESTGGVALTLNDGYGNANVAFNHALGKPSVNGSSGRIEVGVDAATGYMNLEVGDNSVANETKVLTPQITINSGRIQNFFQTDIHSNLTIKSNATHLGFNAASSDTELANILMDSSSGLEISCTTSTTNAKKIRIRPANSDTVVFDGSASTFSKKIIVTDTTAGSQNAGSIHTDGGISANGHCHFGSSSTPALFTGSSNVAVGTSNATSKFVIAASSANAQIELRRTDSNTTGSYGAVNWTANDGHSVSSISAVGDGDSNGGELVFKTTTAAGERNPYGSNTTERLRIHSNGVSEFKGTAINAPKTITHTSSSELVIDLRESNIFDITIGSSFTLNMLNDGLTACLGGAFTIIIRNRANHDINFNDEFYFTGGDPLLTTGGETNNPKIDMISGVVLPHPSTSNNSNVMYCAINYDMASA